MTAAVRRWAALVLMAATLSASSGCLWLAAGAACAGGAAAGYAYLRAPLYREFSVSVADAQAAARLALAELQFPPPTEEKTADGVVLESRTGDDHKVRIEVAARPMPIPAEGPVTRLSVRVGTFGDEVVSQRLLDHAGMHLVAPGAASAAKPESGRLQPVALPPAPPPLPAETPPPPLAADPPWRPLPPTPRPQ
jgi:hypothetical protein